MFLWWLRPRLVYYRNVHTRATRGQHSYAEMRRESISWPPLLSSESRASPSLAKPSTARSRSSPTTPSPTTPASLSTTSSTTTARFSRSPPRLWVSEPMRVRQAGYPVYHFWTCLSHSLHRCVSMLMSRKRRKRTKTQTAKANSHLHYHLDCQRFALCP